MKNRLSILLVSLFLYSGIYAGNIKVISSSKSSLVFSYTLGKFDTSVVTLNGEKFIRINSGNLIPDPDVKFGEPQSLISVVNVGVPQEFGNTIQILKTNYQTLKGKLIPKIDFDNPEVDEQLYNESPTNQSEIVTFGKFGKIRELNVQEIIIRPVIFNRRSNEIKVFTNIVVKVNFPQVQFSGVEKESDEIEFLKNSVLNFDVAKNWIKEKRNVKKTSSRSVMEEGTWYRFEAPEEGIYKITRDMLSSLGIDADNVDPRTIKIYNNGGYILPWKVSAKRPNGITENAIYIKGEEDGSFDAGDYILFYGRGTSFFEYDKDAGKFVRNKHWYSKQNYYYITSGGENGKRMQPKVSLNESNAYKQTSTKAFKFWDEDKNYILPSGIIVVGDDFSLNNNSRSYVSMLDNRIETEPVKYTLQFVNTTENVSQLQVYENSKLILVRGLLGRRTSVQPDYNFGRLFNGTALYEGALPENRSVLKFVFNPSESISKGYLDYFEIEYTAALRAVNNSLIIFGEKRDTVAEFKVSGFSSTDIYCFDISDFSNVKIFKDDKLNGGEVVFQTRLSSDERYKFIAVESSGFLKPENFKKVENSNLLSEKNGAEYLIITNKKFHDAAERLAEFRRNESPYPLSSLVAYVDEIFNEFSMGMLDPTAIRDYIMWGYNNWNVKPKYVLLFGDGNYDYLNLLELDKNFVPTFQHQQLNPFGTKIFNEIYTYSMDDYFSRISGDDDKADIGIARLPVASVEEAESVVDKIITYETGTEKGLWRNTITLVTDDGITSQGRDQAYHWIQSETLSENYIPASFDQNKIYLSVYPTVISGFGRRKPEVNKAIISSINNGTLIINYIGHGSPDLWAHERVFEKDITIPQLHNDKYFFLTAATCDFGKFDDPNNTSGTEELLAIKDRGAIGALTAVRPVYSGENAALNNVFYSKLFGSRDDEGYPKRIGQVYFELKQNKTGENDEKFHLFGDPALRLDEPILRSKIDSVNNLALDDTVQIKALGDVKIEGTVYNVDGSPMNFDGEAIISVFDSEREVELKDVNGTMKTQGGIIFRGKASIENGKFSTGFVVPKDISYENKNGKIIAYVLNDEEDGVGFTKNIIVGGIDSTKTNDKAGPEIEIFFDDEKFADSYLVNPDFTLIVKLKDETGLNTTGLGVGHKLEAILNDDVENSIDLTNYFIGDLNSFGRSGVVKYKFNSLEPGDYNLKIKAWDVFNNYSIAESYFTVVEDNGLVIHDLYNYPNPFSGSTSFTFQHNLAQPVDVNIKIFTIAGRMIKEIKRYGLLEKFVKINWDGTDEDGNVLANGTYLYKVSVKTIDGAFSDNLLGKLSIIK